MIVDTCIRFHVQKQNIIVIYFGWSYGFRYLEVNFMCASLRKL